MRDNIFFLFFPIFFFPFPPFPICFVMTPVWLWLLTKNAALGFLCQGLCLNTRNRMNCKVREKNKKESLAET